MVTATSTLPDACARAFPGWTCGTAVRVPASCWTRIRRWPRAPSASRPRPARITVTGGPFSGVIYGVEELIARAGDEPGRLTLDAGVIEDAPAWPIAPSGPGTTPPTGSCSQVGQQEIGVFNPYGKPPCGFLADYRRVVDFCSRNRIAAVVIYGFLRDPHGGVEAAQELCRYATERGVRILPGIAIGSYGGVYWEGDHRYNLATWLRANPQHAATLEKGVGFQIADLAFPLNFPKSDYTLSACPSAPETMAWMEEGVAWLTETFDIGGINIEAGDYGVCGCDRCVARRANEAEAARRVDDLGDSWSHTDMADNFPRLYRTAKAIKPDLWLYSEIQWDNLLDPVAHEAQRRLPHGGIYQHTTNRTLLGPHRGASCTRDYVAGAAHAAQRAALPVRLPVERRRAQRALLRSTPASSATWRACVATRGMHGLTVWGEPSPYHATVELSYLAFARFSWDPTLTWERFLAAGRGAAAGRCRRGDGVRRRRRGARCPARRCPWRGCRPCAPRPWPIAPTTRLAAAGSRSRTRSRDGIYMGA